MKRLLWMVACWLAAGQVFAVDSQLVLCDGFRDGSGIYQVKDRRDLIEKAIRKLDDGAIDPPSPILATGKLTYLDVSAAFPADLAKVHVLGYLHVKGKANCMIPLQVNHVEKVKSEGEGAHGEMTRIYYRMPDIDRLGDPFAMYHSLSLRIAAFENEGGIEELGEPFFGRRLSLTVSRKYPAVCLSLLFAAVFYFLAVAAVTAIVRRETNAPDRNWRESFGRLMPWNLLSDNGHTALSQLQMLLFTLIVATLLFYQWLRTGLLQELSTDLLYLIGISTVGAAGSQVTASLKKGLDQKAYQFVQQLGWFTAPFARLQRRTDPAELLMTNKRFDANKFQMLVFTVVIAAYVIEAGASELDTLHISTTLLTLMGISQGAYVGGHATSDSMATLAHQLLGLQNLQRRYRNISDPQAKDELCRRFKQAAARAAVMFGAIYGREIPADMLEMPIDADMSPAEADEAVTE